MRNIPPVNAVPAGTLPQSSPVVSVVLSVYNAEDYIEESISSVLGQTYSDFECIIVNDGSTDKTSTIVERFHQSDSRLCVINQENAGLTVSLVRGVNTARGKLIARIDADDVWEPEKLARQVAFLEQHSDIGLIGTGYFLIDAGGVRIGEQDVPLIIDCDEIYSAALTQNPFFHSSVLFRRSLIDQCGNYDPDFSTAQDYDLWVRLLQVSKGYNLDEKLARRRITEGMISAAKERKQRLAALRIKFRERWRRKCFRGAFVSLCKDLAVITLPRPVLERLRSRL